MRHQAIRNKYPEIVIVDDSDGAFDNEGNKISIDEEIIEIELERLQAEYDAKEYQRSRAKEYPSFADQFDLLYHGGYDAWKEAIQTIKDKYPR
jgi:hypothetical protein